MWEKNITGKQYSSEHRQEFAEPEKGQRVTEFRRYLQIFLCAAAAVLAAGCGPVTVNPPAVAVNRKTAFALDENGKYTFLPESRARGIFLSDIYGNFLAPVTGFRHICGWCDFSPADNMLLYVKKETAKSGAEQYVLAAYDLKTEEETPEFISTRYIWFPRWSPNGKYIAFCGEGRNEVTVINWRKNEVVYRVKTNSVFYRWLPDASGLLTVDLLDEIDSIEGGTMHYFIIRKKFFEKGKDTEDLIRGYSRNCWPDISSDGNRIVFNAVEFSGPTSMIVDAFDQKEHVYLYEYAEKKVRRITGKGISAFYAVISPDGSKVAFVDCENDILSGGDLWVADLTRELYSLRKIWDRERAVYPFWCGDNVVGFVHLDPDTKIGKGFDGIYIYNIGNSNLISLKDRIQMLFKKKNNENNAE